MLKSIRIKNFKALKDTESLEIKPITFLVGPNSSGKSSLFQFLLALRQTSKYHDYNYPLILRDYVDLGSYKDLIFNHNIDNNLEIEISLEDSIRRESITTHTFEFAIQRTGREAGKIFINSLTYKGPFNFYEFAKMETDNNIKPSSNKSILHAEIKERRFKSVVIEVIKEPRKKYYSLIFREPDSLRDTKLNVTIANFHRIIPERRKYVIPIPYFEIIRGIEDLFSNLFHIGPLREEPQRVYTTAGIIPKDVGKTGKWSIDALLMEPQARQKTKYWLNKFNISSDIEIKELKKGSKRYEIILKDIHTGIEVNLADVGFGASQILPIIIEIFISPPNSTILLEQPEIHLHPKAQAMMGELLVDAVLRNDKTLIIETHSDLILSGTCTMVAKKQIDADKVIIYYFDPIPDGTLIKKININSEGQYENFPEGFFDERYEEAKKRMELFLEKN